MSYLVQKYNRPDAAAGRSDVELRMDFEFAQALIAAQPGSDGAVRVGVVRDWIGQERRRRISGLNGPLRASG